MTNAELMREAGAIVDRCCRNVVNVLVIGRGLRMTPAELEAVRGSLSAAVAEGIALGEKYLVERDTHRPPPTIPDNDTSSTRPGFLRGRVPKR